MTIIVYLSIIVWDSSGRLRSPGLYDGHFTDFGRYDACINIEVAERIINASNIETNETKSIIIPAFHGKYARLYTQFSPSTNIFQAYTNPNNKKVFATPSPQDARSTFRTTRKHIWDIDIDVQGEDDLSYHKDFGLDFESKNITNTLIQDLILVGQIMLLSLEDTILFKKVFSLYQKVLFLF